MRYKVLIILLTLIVTSCKVQKLKNLDYLPESLVREDSNPKLNVFTPKEKPNDLMPVIIFVHGGNWNRGDKDTYGFYGKDLAKQNIVLVVPEYTLSPKVTYDTQAQQIAACIKWAKNNIEQYGGDPNQVFMNGHSAGGHLAALSVMNPKYNIDQNSISGIILNDAAGLDMHWQNTVKPPKTDGFYDYGTTFTMDPEVWKDASPINHISKNNPPFLIFQGEKTIDAIAKTNEDFVKKLRVFQPDVKYLKYPKGHFQMMLQFIWFGDELYKEMESFMAENK